MQSRRWAPSFCGNRWPTAGQAAMRYTEIRPVTHLHIAPCAQPI